MIPIFLVFLNPFFINFLGKNMIPRFQKFTTRKALLIYWQTALSKLVQTALEKRSIKFAVKLALFFRRKVTKVLLLYSKNYVEVTEIVRYVV